MDPYRLSGWLVPIACIAGAAYGVYGQQQSLHAAQSKYDQANVAFEAASSLKAQIDKQPVERRFAAVEDNPMEETLFLTDLRDRAKMNNVSIVQWTSRAQVYGSTETTAPAALAGGSDAKLLKGLTRIDCDLKVAGDYKSVRSFIGGLTDSDRLFAIHNVVWTRAKTGGTELSLSLSRYVAPPKATPSTLPVSSASADNSGNRPTQ